MIELPSPTELPDKRNFSDWLETFVQYAAEPGEAPRRMYFWAGVSAIAGALRRKVWIDLASFRWYANFYIIFVAPPGVVSKSTTSDVAIRLLRRVPAIKFGPDVVTWQSLVTTFAESAETFECNGEHITMSALTLEASEFGNLLNPQDREMVDIYVRLWDSKDGTFEKRTKHSGNDMVINPWINMIACTTPAWIAGNFPEYIIGGGFTSRCVFVFADKKDKLVAYPDEFVPPNHKEIGDRLVQDLTMISQRLSGPMRLTKGAREWGHAWYQEHHSTQHLDLDPDRFGGYLSRKQSMIHKLGMILSISAGDSMQITEDDLALAERMVTGLETDMAKVFARIGQSDNAVTADRLVTYIRARGKVKYQEAFRFVHAQMPSMRDFEDLLASCLRTGLVTTQQVGADIWICAVYKVGDRVIELPPGVEDPSTFPTSTSEVSK